MSSDPPRRRYSKRPLPPYRHVPGTTPHPERDPAGHMYGRKEPRRKAWSPDRWRENDLYLYGVDLFNYGYWWEAHAEWESLWQTTGRSDLPGLFLQGLIQVAAALVQHRAGRAEGARRLGAKGIRKLRGVPKELGGSNEDRDILYMGVDIAGFADRIESFLASDPGTGGAPPVLELA